MTSRFVVRTPTRPPAPIIAIGRRVALALASVAFIVVVVLIERDGYNDNSDGVVSVLDAIYYASVSVTTTGYGDITPVSSTARLLTILLVTPARILFLVLLVGTTIEVLTEQTRQILATRKWRRRVRDHYIICGYGSTGRSALSALEAQGVDRSSILVIDTDPHVISDAIEAGLVGIEGDASRTTVLAAAEIELARAVIVTPNRDDTGVLITLTAREMNPAVTIVSGGREEENLHLLRQSGADSVIHSAAAVGRLVGLATQSASVALILDELLTAGSGLEVIECAAVQGTDGVFGPPAGATVLAILRGDEHFAPGARGVADIVATDRLVILQPESGSGRRDGVRSTAPRRSAS